MGYAMYYGNSLYGYNPYGYQQYGYKPTYNAWAAPAPVVSGPADVDMEELEKIATKANPVATEAFGYIKGLLPSSGPTVRNGQVITKYGDFPIDVNSRVSKADRKAVVPVLEELAAVMKQEKLNARDVEKLLTLARDLAAKLPSTLEDLDFDFL